jgi:hypothetical protein
MHPDVPEAAVASGTTLRDRLCGKAVTVQGRRVVMTGTGGSFGAPFQALLEQAGAHVVPLKFGRDYTYDEYAPAEAHLKGADILVLCHGSKKDHAQEANCDSYLALITRFYALNAGRPGPLEVWACGSEIEAHPAFGDADLAIYLKSKRAYARFARALFHDRRFVYRHIVASAFSSAMGPGLISGETAARWAWMLIRHGCRYVPVTYTGIAFVNYFKFLFRWHATELPMGTPNQPVSP